MTSSTPPPPPPPQCSSSDTSSSTCPVCREVFTEPKLLPCAHVVCRGCLLTRLTGESPPENTCPLCHATVLSPRDLHDFRDKPEVALDRVLLDDYGTMAVLWSQDVLRRPVGEDGGRCAGVCGLCQKEEPSSFCPDCRGGGLLLCQDCVPLHARFPDARQHVHVAALGEFTVERLAASGQVTCRRHPDWPVVRYCPAHREVLCALCEAEHATTAAGCCGAEREEVGGAAERERGRLRDLGSRLLDAGSVLNNKINHLEQDLHQGQQNFTAASLTIKRQMDQLSQALDSRRQELLHMVHKEQQRFLAAATSELASLIELNQVVVTHGQAADRLATTTPGPHLLTMMTRLLPRLAHLENRCAEETSPLPSPTPPSPSSPPTPTGSWPIEGEHQGSESETKSAHDAAELEGACGDDNGQRQQPSWAEAGTPQPAPDADTPTSVPHERSATPPPEPVPHERSATPPSEPVPHERSATPPSEPVPHERSATPPPEPVPHERSATPPPEPVPHERSATPPSEPVPHERSATPRGVEASPQATLEVRCWAADLVLDGQTVEEVQNAIARIDFHPGVCTEDCEATIAACCFPRSHTELDAPGAEAEDTLGVSVHDKHKGKPNYVDDTIIDQTSPPAAHETRDGKELSENCASAEHGTDTAQGRQSSAQQTVTPPPPAEDGFREPGQEDYVHVLSSSASSEVRSPEHLAPLPADDGLSSGHHVVTAESVAREFGPRRQSALSRFLPSLITRYLDKTSHQSPGQNSVTRPLTFRRRTRVTATTPHR
ncbi:uncharacterized protein LOC143277812 isoform X2 [Babylonia areolata]|uniref:uncharacterized protein LOC143277812 isoform X2 n=1 Tax=Babylonia areolata TaxID=304850 RepID=UPI003FD29836